jgi:hypothetical protein
LKEQLGSEYQGSDYLKALGVSESKAGKTTFLVAQALGLFPGQKRGGLVSHPRDLHIISFDMDAVSGVRRFLKELCGAPDEALQYNVYNFEDDARKLATNLTDYDHTIFNSLNVVQQRIRERVAKNKGTPVVLMSSLTGLALAIERSIMGKPGTSNNGKGYGDQSKWMMLQGQLNELQNMFQLDSWHCFWEGHLYTPKATGQGGESGEDKVTIQVRGKAGQTWAYNVAEAFRLRRMFGQPVEGSRVDKVYMDTRPNLEFIAGGRNFTEALEPKEFDIVKVAMKLGKKAGHWGQKDAPVKKVKK